MNKSQALSFATTLYILITLTMFSLPTCVFAQENQKHDYLVLYVGDTLYGTVQYIDEGIPREFYKKIRLETSEGKRKKYKRKNVASFRVSNITYESFWLSQTSQRFSLVNPKYNIDHNNGEQYFLKVVGKGNLNHYELEWIDQGESVLWSMSLLNKQEDPFFIRADQGLLGLKRKVLLNYFFNCPKLKEEINLKQLNKVWQVVDFYNKNCID
jgi:hypothetical protein